jgi:DNA-binding beta-propeller fold protein YncE
VYRSVAKKHALKLRDPRMTLILALLMLLAGCGGQVEGPSATDEKNGVPSAGRVTETLRTRPTGTPFLAVGAGSLWMPTSGTITRVDLGESKVTAVINVGSKEGPASVAASGDQIWFTDHAKEAVSRIDPQTNRIVERIPVGFAVYDIAIDGDTLWLTDLGFATAGGNVVVRVDTNSNRIVERIDVPAPATITVGGGAVWVVEFGAVRGKPSKVARIDPRTNEVVEEIPVETYYPYHMAFGAGSIWIANGLDIEKPSRDKLSVSRLDPKTNKEVARIDTGLNMWSLVVDGGSVWAAGSPPDCASSDEGALVRIDPTTNEVVGRTNVRCAYSVAATDDAVLVHSGIEPGAGGNFGDETGAVTWVEPAR